MSVSLIVPGLWLSEVQVVDAVQIHVLCVPREGTLPHAKIEVWGVDSLDLYPALVLHSVQNGVKMANVPLSHILQRMDSAEAVNRNDTDIKVQHVIPLTDQETRNYWTWLNVSIHLNFCFSTMKGWKFQLVALLNLLPLTGSYSVPLTSAP